MSKFGVLAVTFDRDTGKFVRSFCLDVNHQVIEYDTIVEATHMAELLTTNAANNGETGVGFRAKEIV